MTRRAVFLYRRGGAASDDSGIRIRRATTASILAGCCNPANAFARPITVVDDQDLTLTEKRAILSSLGVRRAQAARRACCRAGDHLLSTT